MKYFRVSTGFAPLHCLPKTRSESKAKDSME
jgi:hypothetical protein